MAPIILLFENADANGDSPEIELPISAQQPLQTVRHYHYAMTGVWDTATMVFAISIDGGTTWITIASKTADFSGTVKLGPCLVKFTLSSIDTLTDLHASING